MENVKFNCTKCGSDKFEIVGNAERMPVVLSEPIRHRVVTKFVVRCADCKEPIHSFYDKDLTP